MRRDGVAGALRETEAFVLRRHLTGEERCRRFGSVAPHTTATRRGSVLFVVLVVIALLTLAAYQFSEIMLTESSAANSYGRKVRVRAAADSGIEVAAMALGQRQIITTQNVADANLYHNPELFGGVMVYGTPQTPPRGRGRYSIISPVENDETARTVRFGLADESGKLNVNVLSVIAGDDEEGQERARLILLAIPEMTEEIADAILDWIDEDDEERPFGAESSYYSQFNYEAKNGPLESLDELLLIRGITPQLLFGYDANRNGLIDPVEAEAAAQTPDFPPLGWSAFFTVHSKEWNRRLGGDRHGEPKININTGILAELYDNLVDEFSQSQFDAEEVAKFIVAYRMNGPAQSEDEGEEGEGGNGQGQTASQPLASSASPSGTGSRGRAPPGDDDGGAELDSQTAERFAQGLAQSLFGRQGNGEASVTRGGMELSDGANFNINSLYDLVDAEVEVEVNGTRTTLQSPFSSENLAEYMPDLLNRLTTVSEEFVTGRVNVNQSRREVLIGVISAVDGFQDDPNLAIDLAQKIVNAKLIDSNGMPRTEVLASRSSTAWLVTEGLVTLPQMRQLDRHLTTRGDVYRAQVIGYFDEGGPVSRQEVVIDATQRPPRVVFLRDLSDLGKGFTPQQLGSPVE